MDGSASEPDPGPEVRSAPSPVEALRVRPTQQGVVYLWTIAIFSGVLWWQGENLVFLLGTLALGSGCVAWFLARRNLGRLALTRDLPARTQAGVPTTLRWSVRSNARTAAVGVEFEDRPARGIRPLRLQVEVPVVPAQGTVRCEGRIRFGRRGPMDLGRHPLMVSSRFPLGLFLAEGRATVRGTILVRAREGRVTPALRAFLRGRARAAARQAQLWQGDDVIYGVREYREGDDPRRIHWRSSARRGATIVSEWRSEHGEEIILLLGRAQGAGRPSEAAFERAVSAAATIWRECARQNLRVRLILGERRDLVLRGSGQGLEAGLDALARVKARGRRRPRQSLRRLAEQAGSRRTLLYLGAGAEAGVEALCKAAAGRGGSHLVMRTDLRSVLRWFREPAR